MWPKKQKNRTEHFKFPGKKHALDGHGVVYAVETMASEAVLVRAVPELAEITGPMRNLAPPGHETISGQPVQTRQIDRLRPLLGQLAGCSQVGLRVAGLTNSLDATHEALSSASGKRLTYVINLTCRALQRQAGALHGGHDDYYRVADAGCFQFFAKNAQETADLTLIAHRVAELALTPGICAQDYYRTTHSVQTVRLPERGLAALYLGRPDDAIPCPTPAQRFLFGERRRRIPLLMDRDRPAGIGGIQDHESYFKAVAGQRSFFSDHIDQIIEKSMREYAELTGRVYEKASGYRVEDADVVVIAQGAVVEELEAVVDYLRKREKIKAGVVNLTTFRPFPGAELTHMLKGRKAVTILERTDQPLAEDLPMTKEIRSALDKAFENGAVDDSNLPYPDYERYIRPSDKPRLFTGIYGVGTRLPSFGDLCEAFRNMLTKGTAKRVFYVGALFDPPDRRFPHLQSLQQRLSRDYPGLQEMTVSASNDVEGKVGRPGYAMQLHSLAVQGGIFAGNLLAQTLANALDWTIKTFPEGGLEPTIQPVSFTVLHAKDDGPLKSKPDRLDMVLVSGDRLVEDLPARVHVKKGGMLIIESNRNPKDLWFSLSNRTIEWIHDGELQVRVIDARKIALETASRPSFVDQLAIWALFGAYLKVGEHVSDADFELFSERFRERLEQLFGEAHYLIEDITKCLARGAGELVELDWMTLSEERRPVHIESEAPWTVQEVDRQDQTVFDVNRFWHSVGYLYSAGEIDKTVTDPFLATGIMPAGSSAFRDMTPYRLRIPRWLPARCEACGLCWSLCPDSALPPTVQTLSSILKSAMSQCEENGQTMIQMQRATDHLAKQAYNLVVKDDGGEYTTLGPLFSKAFIRLVEKMGLKGDQLDTINKEFSHVHRLLEHHPVSKTDTFFNEPHKASKGSGCLLSITHNPLSCTGCGLCVEVCPNNAYEWADQTRDLLDRQRRVWEFQMKLPEVSSDDIRESVSAADVETNVYRLLSKSAYHSMVGGDAAFPGSSVKTAIHLVTATIESVMRARIDAHIERLRGLIEQVENRIQGNITEALQINDFESFGRRLSRIQRRGLTSEALAKMLGDESDAREVDQDQLERLTGLLGQLKEQHALYTGNGGGTGRSRMVATIDPGGSAFWSGTYPYNPHRHPWISHLPGDASALAEGVFEGITRQMVEDFKICRKAELVASDSYDPAEHDSFFEKFTHHDLNDEELDLMPPILVIGQSQSTSCREIGRLLASAHPIRVVIINDHAISVPGRASEGVEKSGELNGARVEGDLDYFLLSQRGVFVLQSTVGHPGHLIQGVAQGLAQRRPALFHVYAPDPQANGVAPEKVIEQARMAFESRTFPLFKLNPERSDAPLSLEANPDPGADWALRELEVEEPSGLQTSITAPLTVADWAFGEARFQRHFEVVPKGQLNDEMKSMAEYLENTGEREGIQPYIDVTDENRQHFLAIVSPEMTRAVERRLAFWNYLRELSEVITPEPRVAAETPTETEPPAPLQPKLDQTVKQRLTETFLHLSGYRQDPDFFKQTLGQFITRHTQATSIEEIGDD